MYLREASILQKRPVCSHSELLSILLRCPQHSVVLVSVIREL